MNKLQTIFSAGDYQRYHSGQMSAAEMNALEKAAMADPFIQDSLDGYAQLPHAKDDILRLKERLKTIIEKKEKKSLAWLWRVAAILISGASIGLLVYKNAGDKPEI